MKGPCKTCGAIEGPFVPFRGRPVCKDALSCNIRYLKQTDCNSPEDCGTLTGAYSFSDTL